MPLRIVLHRVRIPMPMKDDPRLLLGASDRQGLLDAALEFSEVCRDVIAHTVSGGIDINAKPDESLVTSADLAAERAFRERLEHRFPQMGVMGEEFGHTRSDSPYQWVIDPIDGTADFARGLPIWGSIIGLFYHGRPLIGVIDHPDLGLRLHAGFGLGAFSNGKKVSLDDYDSSSADAAARLGIPSRSNFIKRSEDGKAFDRLTAAYPDFRVFRSCLSHAYATTGQLDAALEWDVNLWDLAATQILIEEAGGRYISLRERDHSGTGMLYCAVFGRRSLVERIAGLMSAQI